MQWTLSTVIRNEFISSFGINQKMHETLLLQYCVGINAVFYPLLNDTLINNINFLILFITQAAETYRSESTHASIQKSHASQEVNRLRKDLEITKRESDQVPPVKTCQPDISWCTPNQDMSARYQLVYPQSKHVSEITAGVPPVNTYQRENRITINQKFYTSL